MTQQKELYATAGANCRPGLALSPKYITIHNTANTSRGAGAQSHAAYLRGAGKDKYVSWHYAVDDKLITHCIPDGEVAWHASTSGKGCGGIYPHVAQVGKAKGRTWIWKAHAVNAYVRHVAR